MEKETGPGFIDRLDAEHRQALDQLPQGLTDLTNIADTRGRVDTLMRAAAARAPQISDVTIEDAVVPGAADRPDLAIRLYRPADAPDPSPAMLFIHGGGFVMGEVFHFDAQCMALAKGAGLVLASIDYRLAPEHSFPAPLEDCHAALAWMHAQGEARGFDTHRIGIGGTSAGSGLAAGLALLARDRCSVPVAFQFLEAPMLDHRTLTPSSCAIEDKRVWNAQTNRDAWTAYLGIDHLESAVPIYASPTLAEDLTGLPPAFISIGGQDCFADEAIDYAQRLRRAGVPVQFHLYEVGFHGSPRMLPNAPASKRWRRDAIEALSRLAGTSGRDLSSIPFQEQ